MLSVEGVSKRFGELVALDGCSLTVDRGNILGFLGPNGAGKTTTMRIILGLIDPDVGAVSWDGRPVDTAARLRFGYMPEERGLYPRMPLHDQLVYHGRLHGMAKVAAVAEATRLLEMLGLEDRSDAKIEELSHGNQQRAQLAVALMHDPELLVLDEPFAGLDPIGVDALSNVLNERASTGTAVLFSSHQLDLVEDMCRQVVIINEGAVVLAGEVDELRHSSPRRYLDVVLEGGSADWVDRLEGVDLVAHNGSRFRLLVDDAVRVSDVATWAEQAGSLREFSFTPPDLSEVFRESVRRSE
ncbi:MAG TPA: ATP-binding cassette domain-containing protein [Acidimicrobiia bacterium]|nr:ATP-binding cassette domain-containing protein [Acidimicrobiia bacterium]